MSFLSGKSSAEFQSQLWDTPNWLIKRVDFRRGLASFVETDERGYREAAFLDLPPNHEQIRQVTLHSPLLRFYSKNVQVS